jgi:hypothetical protein
MTRSATAQRAAAGSRPGPVADGWLVHGVLPAGTAPPDPVVDVVTHRGVAAVVRPPTARQISGTRRELLTHADVLDGIAAAARPILPLRFGTVVHSRDAVASDLLAPYHDAFVAALATLRGRAQFTVRAKYVSDAILREVLERDPGTRRLHQRMRARHHTAEHSDRVVLGERVAQALMANRDADAALLADTLGSYATISSVQIYSAVEGYRIADAAFLVDLEKREGFEEAAERLAGRWRGRVRVRLLGPMAAYHFADRLIYGPLEGRSGP